MTDWFVSGHAGAFEWAARRGIVARGVAHLDPALVQPGDRVMGTLPVPLAAQVCAIGASYWHLVLDLPAEARQRPLDADMMDSFGARLECYVVMPRDAK
jgi:CRISPR-associated protein Csx16